MKMEEKNPNIAVEDRAVLEERVRTQTISGQKLIAIGMLQLQP